MAAERFIGGLRLLPSGTTTPRVVLGHVWSWGLNATGPLAELSVDDQRVLLRPRWGWLRRLTRVLFFFTEVEWEAPRDGVSAEAFGSGEMTRGVLLKAPGRSSAIFWCSERTQRVVLATLQAERTSF
jgi:hypothetical protein